MSKGIVVTGASAIALALLVGSAEAKKVSYEINGQRYSYSTNNRAQVEEARQRIEAANSAAAAKARADVERAGNPLVGVFGSETQREAEAAQARAAQVLNQAAPPPTTQPSIESTGSTGRSAQRPQTRAEARAEAREARRQARLERARSKESTQTARKEKQPAPAHAERPGSEPRQQTAAVDRPEKAPAGTQAGASKPPAPMVAEPLAPKTGGKGAVKSVSFDLSTGIKTIETTDGKLHEEPFESSTASKVIEAAQPPGSSLTSFVDAVRKPAQQTPAPESAPKPAGSSPPKN